MIYLQDCKLPVLHINYNVEGGGTLSSDVLMDKVREVPSSLIYAVSDGALIGAVSTGDIDRAKDAGMREVPINTNITKLKRGDSIAALSIFKERENINNIPVIDDDGRLVGEFCRWDDAFLLEPASLGRLSKTWNGEAAKRMCGDFDKVILVEPHASRSDLLPAFDLITDLFKDAEIDTIRSKTSDVIDRIDCDGLALILAIDKSVTAAIHLMIKHAHRDGKTMVVPTLDTYAQFITNTAGHAFARDVLLGCIDRNVKVLQLHITDDRSEYFNNFKIWQRDNAAARKTLTTSRDVLEPFFMELYSEEYTDALKSQWFRLAIKDGVYRLGDARSDLWNVTDGKRHTCGVPGGARESILFFGPCIATGVFAEDANTIESFLQKKLNEDGIFAAAANHGMSANDFHILYRLAKTDLREGDTVIIALQFSRSLDDRISSLNLVDVMRDSDIPFEWYINSPLHCNHRVNKIYADAIYDAVKDGVADYSFDAHKVDQLDDMLIESCLDRYYRCFFKDVDLESFGSVGAIVMNCNPFTKGHRYLIEHAHDRVDHLIIFVVSEDRSIFTFEMRYAMICLGVADLKDVSVIPSGELILSGRSFPEYFTKTLDEDLIRNTEYDITTFAEHIAPALHITHRFVGEEPEDAVTRAYNDAMKKILPSHGIELVEIPRIADGCGVISASRVRKCIEQNDPDALDELVPMTTKRILIPTSS